MSPEVQCRRGHPYTPENTYTSPRGQHKCRPCARLRQAGLLKAPAPVKTLSERYWGKVNKNGPAPTNRPGLGPCWLWTGTLTKGYGQIFHHREGPIQVNAQAHRVIFELLGADIPPDCEPDHLCLVKHCVNPAHMEIVSHGENTRRAHLQDFCKYGHILRNNQTVSGNCKTCANTRQRQKYRESQAPCRL